MKIIGIGLVVLVMQLFPTGWVTTILTGGMYGPIFKGISPIWYNISSFIISLLIASLIIWVFLRKTQLFSRLPEKVPGKMWFISGIILVVIFIAILLFASTIQGGGPAFAVMQLAPYFLLPSKVLLIVGAVKVFLSASPVNKVS